MTNRRDFLVRFTMAAGAVSILKPLNAFASVGGKCLTPTRTSMLTILHTANIQGQWSSLGITEKLSGLGGLQNITEKLAGIRNENSAAVVIDAGNMSGHRQTREERLNFYKRVSDAGYDAVIPGWTDLALGTTCFAEIANVSGVNIVPYNKQLGINASLLPYSILKKGKACIGIINAGIPALKDAQNTSTLPLAMVINQTAQLLRSSKNCTLIICVVQSSDKKCLKLAGLSAGIDVMICAVDKTSLHNTQIIRNKSNHEVIISYAGAKGATISRIDFTFNECGEKINMASKAIFTGAENESYAGILKRYAAYSA